MSDQWQEFRCNGTVGEVGQNKVNNVDLDLGDLIKLGQKILTSNSSQSVGGKYYRIAMKSSNFNQLQI